MKTKLRKFILLSKYILHGIAAQVILFSFCLASDTNAQKVSLEQIEVNIGFEQVQVEEAFSIIESTSDYRFAYRESELSKSKISLTKSKRTLAQLLRELSKQSNLSFRRVDHTIHVKPMKEGAVDFSEEMSKSEVIKGTVKDENGEGLPGATVIVKGHSAGTVTDIDGGFTLDVPAGYDVITVSFVGYLQQDVNIGSRSVIDVSLELDVTSLEEVVVVGYGVQKKKDVTGAVSKVDADEIGQVASVSLDQAIQGRISGVQVTQNTGQPGGDVSVKIRGAGSIFFGSEPLYIIDGVPVEGANLSLINPNDIESVDVLKDAASAAIYGARASNGVILVTTKKGEAGKARVSFNMYAGMQYPSNLYEMMNAKQFVELSNEAYTNTQNDPNIVGQTPGPNQDWQDLNSVADTDWQREIFKPAPFQNYSINVSGGSEKVQASFSAGYTDQEGILIGSGFDRISLRAASDYQASKKLKFGMTANITTSHQESTSTDNDYSGALQTALRAIPVWESHTKNEGPYNDNYYGYNGLSFVNQVVADDDYYSNMVNPIYAVQDWPEQWNDTNTFLGLIYGEWNIIESLKFRSSGSLFTSTAESWNRTAPIPGEIAQSVSDNLSNTIWNRERWNTINTLTFTKGFGNHNVSAMVGYDVLEENNFWVSATGRFQNDPQTEFPSINGAQVKEAGGTYDRRANQSIIGRINYDYKGKYLLTVNFRRDGSSKFGPQHRWGNFPSMSAGWRVSDESFFQGVGLINDLKVRASWGIVGNDAIPANSYHAKLGFQDDGTSQYPTIQGESLPIQSSFYNANTGEEQLYFGSETKNLPDKGIKWEQTEEINFGLDMGLLDDRVRVTFDVYQKTISDMLAYLTVPASFGSPQKDANLLTNFAEMENRGLELAINYRSTIGEVEFNIGGNYAYQENEVKELDGNSSFVPLVNSGSFINFSPLTSTAEGYSVGQFWGYVTDGIYQTRSEISSDPVQPTWNPAPGDRRYKDISGPDGVPDGIISAWDQTYLGNGLPKHVFGMNLGANYKNFDINLVFVGQAGVKAANLNKRYLYDMLDHSRVGMSNAALDLYKNRWTGPDTSNELPRVAYRSTGQNNYFSDFHIEDASFIRLKNVQLGYSIPRTIIDRWGVSRLRIYVSAQNIFTLTKYSGIDPEVGGSNILTSGTDHGRYPISQIFMTGLNLEF